MSDAVLTVLKFCLLALLYLFLLRVVWIVARELRGTKVPAAAPLPAAVPPPPPARPRAKSTRSKWRLVVLKPDTEKGHEYPVDGEVTLGRGGGCTVRLMSDTFVSQVHARVVDRDGTLWVEDVGSTNGTFVNEKRIELPIKLKRGDRVRVGQTTLEAER